MNSTYIQLEARKIAKSVTKPAIREWLETWYSMQPGHSQYEIRDEQIAIGELALEFEESELKGEKDA